MHEEGELKRGRRRERYEVGDVWRFEEEKSRMEEHSIIERKGPWRNGGAQRGKNKAIKQEKRQTNQRGRWERGRKRQRNVKEGDARRKVGGNIKREEMQKRGCMENGRYEM